MLFSQRGSKRHSKDSLLVILSEIANADKDRFDRFRLFVRGSRDGFQHLVFLKKQRIILNVTE